MDLRELIRKATAGSIIDQAELGYYYSVVVKDLDKATEWFLKASNSGNAVAQPAIP